jgi:uroporphyrinogen decarboxylase
VGVDWRVPLSDAIRVLPRRALQGNLDPAVLLGTEETVRARTLAVLDEGARADGYVFNLGHGILPVTPPRNVAAMLDCVRRYARTDRGEADAGGEVRAQSGRFR